MTRERALALRTTCAVRSCLASCRPTSSPHVGSSLHTARPVIAARSESSWTHCLLPSLPHSSLSLRQPHQYQSLYSHTALPLQTFFLHSQGSQLLWRKLHTHSTQQLSRTPQTTEQQPGIKAQLPKPIANLQQRAVGYLRESLLLSYSALFDNVIFRVAEWLRLDKLFQWLTPGLENGYAAITGLATRSQFA